MLSHVFWVFSWEFQVLSYFSQNFWEIWVFAPVSMGFSEEKRVRQHFRSTFSRKFEFFHREKFETTFSWYFSQNFVNILSFFTCLNGIFSGKRLRQHFSGTFLKILWTFWVSCPFEWDFQWGTVWDNIFRALFSKFLGNFGLLARLNVWDNFSAVNSGKNTRLTDFCVCLLGSEHRVTSLCFKSGLPHFSVLSKIEWLRGFSGYFPLEFQLKWCEKRPRYFVRMQLMFFAACSLVSSLERNFLVLNFVFLSVRSLFLSMLVFVYVWLKRFSVLKIQSRHLVTKFLPLKHECFAYF